MNTNDDFYLEDIEDLHSYTPGDAPNDDGDGKSAIRIVKLHSPREAEAALMAIRMIDGGFWHPRLVRHGLPRDHDVFAMLGLEYQKGNFTVETLRNLLRHQRQKLENRKLPRVDLLGRSINRLGDMLGLNPVERGLVRAATISSQSCQFSDLFRCAGMHPNELAAAYGYAIGYPTAAVKRCFRSEGVLARVGFFTGTTRAFSGRCSLDIDHDLAEALMSDAFDEKRYLRSLVRPAPASRLAMDDFAFIASRDMLQHYLRDSIKRQRLGVNILLYGAPGTGKTEFSRALAESLQIALHEVPNENREGEPISGARRFKAYTMCQSILATKTRQLLLFDEVEDVFGAINRGGGTFYGMNRFDGRDADNLRKSWVNETLETNPVPAVWTCNSIDAIDPAYLRRFDLTIEFSAPSHVIRERVIARYFRKGEISQACAARLARIDTLAPSQVERAARVSRSLRGRHVHHRDAEVERLVAASIHAMGQRPSLAPPVLPKHYDPAFMNTDRDLKKVAAGLAFGHGARLCLYGPPGTGKTAFAHHLGKILDRPVCVKRGSDLQSMYVGEAEKNIAAAFRQARDENAILVIDEADGFLRDRGCAQRSWEVSQVNEMLTQMESFEGIFVASTNLMDTLDTAAMRRFDFKVKFDYLTREQRRGLLKRLIGDFERNTCPSVETLASLDRLDHLAPGDFTNVLRQLHVMGEPTTALRVVELLAAEVALKPDVRARSIGFY